MSSNDLSQSPETSLSTAGSGEPFGAIIERRMSRRTLLKGGAALSALVLMGAEGAAAAPPAAARLTFAPIPASTSDEITVAAGYRAEPLLRWGDPILPAAPPFDPARLTAEAQAQQFGYNCDFVGFLPLPAGSTNSDHGLLVVNHEYTNPELMFQNYDPERPTQEQVDVELAAHGMAVVEIRRGAGGRWEVVQDSPYNRRISAATPMQVSGPAAGHDNLKTADDPEGTTILGTLNNCSAGKTPWGTVLSAEENFHQYFANLAQLTDNDERKRMHQRYGLPEEASERKWERFYPRFDSAREPNEPFRFGWVVEVDPYDPDSVPVKRSALGRMRHEAATVTVAPGGQVVLYSGDDERFEYVYKFVTARRYDPDNRAANKGLLDEGTLYVARFDDDGSGQWLPLVWGSGPLRPENGFNNQGDVLLQTRRAADLLGATKMDRPEDIEVNPVNGRVYMVMTNNTRRGTEGHPGTDAANPRSENKHGQIIEVVEGDNDHASTAFTWELFLLCGDPSDESSYFAGYPKEQVSAISSPDNITFDREGNLWISTDGQPSTLAINDSLCAVPVDGPERGFVRRFLNGVPGGEVAGPEFTPDNRTLFLSIQHPGEGGTVEEPLSNWPDGAGPPRPSVVAIWSESGEAIGLAGSEADQQAGAPGVLPQTGVPQGALSATRLTLLGLGAAALGAAGEWRRRRLAENEQPQDEEPA